MLGVLLLTAGCLGLVTSETDIDDFDFHHRGYEFIFHDSHDLMIAIRGDSCYFVSTPDSEAPSLVRERLHGSGLVLDTENSLIGQIQRNSSGTVRLSTLEAVRNKYADILADFHCLNKRIYEVDLFSMPTATTDDNPGSSIAHYCLHNTAGFHEHPDDCHKFIICSAGITSVETCVEGTAYLDPTHVCMPLAMVPRCDN